MSLKSSYQIWELPQTACGKPNSYIFLLAKMENILLVQILTL